jgi:hypothetical protein
MNSKGEVTDRGSITEASNYIKKGLSGDRYKEYTFTKKFQLVDSQIKNIGE